MTFQVDDKKQDLYFEQGKRAAWIMIMRQAIEALGLDAREASGWQVERAEAIEMLRQVCEEIGDNDWPDNLHLADIIEKHIRWR